MKSGTKPATLDPRDYSFHRTFGTANPLSLPTEYCVDARLTMPDQVAEGNPFSCTAYTTCDLATDQDGKQYAPEYTYMKTLFMQGLPPTTNGSDIRPALRSATVYGLLPKQYMPAEVLGKGEDFTAAQGNWPTAVDQVAGKLENSQGQYFNVWDDGGLDWFQGFQSALWLNRHDKRGISVGTPWFREWQKENVAPSGILTESFVYSGRPETVGWHNWACKGWARHNTKGELINPDTGELYLMVKAWMGSSVGDNGWVYMDRPTVNRVMEIAGSVAYTQANADKKDIFTIKLARIEQALIFLWRLVGMKRYA